MKKMSNNEFNLNNDPDDFEEIYTENEKPNNNSSYYQNESVVDSNIKQYDDEKDDYIVVDKNKKTKIFIAAVISLVLAIIVALANISTTQKKISEIDSNTQNPTIVNETSDKATKETTSTKKDGSNQNVTTTTEVVYQLPPDLSIYGTWHDDTFGDPEDYFVLNYDKSWEFVNGGDGSVSTAIGKHATIVCGEKALTKTGWNWEKTRTKFGIKPEEFNIDNFYYVLLPNEEFIDENGNVYTVEMEFDNKIAEYYMYLYNTPDGSLKAYAIQFGYSGEEDSLSMNFSLIEGE